MRPQTTPPTYQILHARWSRAQAGQPAKQDGANLQLVLGGGGQQGAYSGGFVTGLEVCGALPLFDRVVVTSTGAYVAAWSLTGQSALGTTMYMEENVSSRFIDPHRAASMFFGGRPVLDLSYTLDEAMKTEKPFDFARLCNPLVPLTMVACDADTAETVCLSDFQTAADVRQAMQATACVPVWAGRPVFYQGRRLVDGCVRHNLPIEVASQLGATHMLAVSNSPYGKMLKPASSFYKWLIARQASPALASAVDQAHDRNMALLKQARRIKNITIFESPLLLKVDDKRPAMLWAAAMAGFQDACALMNQTHPFPQIWTRRPGWAPAQAAALIFSPHSPAGSRQKQLGLLSNPA